ncbi:MAG: metallophosphatase [Chthonomonadales bacterium]
MPTYTIYHTNDFHGHLEPAQVDRLTKLRKGIEGRGLLLDAGDAGSSCNITFKSDGEPILTEMSRAGYDAMTVGNRDFHFSLAGFTSKLKLAKFPILCANVRVKESGAMLPAVKYVDFTMSDGFRISVFGITVPMITEKMLSRKVSAYVFDEPISVASHLAKKLRPDCDMLVCLSHIGLKQDHRLAEACSDIDLIVGGHTHAVLESGEIVGRTLLVQAGSWGKLLGKVEINADGGKLALTSTVEPL